MTCRYLTYEDRKSIAALYADGVALADIASALGVHLATIYRELARGNTGELDGNGRSGYNAELAQRALKDSIKHRGRKKTANT